jgi:hypothetical protein
MLKRSPAKETPMPIQLFCPGCQAEFRLADELAGKQVQCASCARLIDVPEVRPASRPMDMELPSGAIQEAARPEPPLPYSPPRTAPTPAAAPPDRPRSWDDEDDERLLRRRRARREEDHVPRRTPTFVWLVPLVFAGLFLVFGVIGGIVIHANRAAHNLGPWQKKAVIMPAPMNGMPAPMNGMPAPMNGEKDKANFK